MKRAVWLLACVGIGCGETSTTMTFRIGGTAEGITRAGLVLQLNGANDLAVSANGAFTFATTVANGESYAVTIEAMPAGQTCTITGGTGVATQDVTNVSVVCAASPEEKYTVGGTVTGVTGPGLVLQLNGAGDLSINQDGPFTFAEELSEGASYAVTIQAEPTGQTCSVTGGTGRIAAADVTSAGVTCTAPPSDDATLAELSVAPGTLAPAFDAGTLQYTARVGVHVASVDVTAVATQSAATITVGGAPATSGTASTVALAPGQNAIDVEVTAPDGVTTQMYTVDVLRGFITQAYLKAPNAGEGGYFGVSADLSGDTLVVAADHDGVSDPTIRHTTDGIPPSDTSFDFLGAVHVFVRDAAGLWQFQAYLKAPNAGATTGQDFGESVAIDGDTIVVGAPYEDSGQDGPSATAPADMGAGNSGAAYVFERTGTTWAFTHYLKATESDGADFFGTSVDISGDTIAVGALWEASSSTAIVNGTGSATDDGADDAGAVYVFRRAGAAWVQEAYIKAPNAGTNDSFGAAVALDGDTLVAGAPGESADDDGTAPVASADDSAPRAGAAYVFARTAMAWSFEAYLKAANSGADDSFGTSVALDGDTIVVGAPQESSAQRTITNGAGAPSDDDAFSSGAAYVFKRAGTTWTQEAYLKASNANDNHGFGARVAVSGDLIAATARLEGSRSTAVVNGGPAPAAQTGSSVGAAYVFVRSGASWSEAAYLKASNAEDGDQLGHSVAAQGGVVAVGGPFEASSSTAAASSAAGDLPTPAGDDDAAQNAGALYVFE